MASASVQQFLTTNPLLVIIALFGVGIISVLSMRILLANVGCLVRLGCAVVVIAVIALLLRLLLVQ